MRIDPFRKRAVSHGVAACAMVIGLLTVAAFATASAAGASEGRLVSGDCLPSSVAAQGDGAVDIALPGVAPGDRVETAELSLVWDRAVNEDVVVGLGGPGDAFVGLFAGAEGTSGDVAFADGASADVRFLDADDAGLISGRVSALDRFAGLAGTPASGPWQVLILNAAATDAMRITECTLTLRLASSSAPVDKSMIPTVSGSSGTSATPVARSAIASLPQTGASLIAITIFGVLALVVGCGLTRRSGRSAIACLCILAMVAGTAAPAAAKESPPGAQLDPADEAPSDVADPTSEDSAAADATDDGRDDDDLTQDGTSTEDHDGSLPDPDEATSAESPEPEPVAAVEPSGSTVQTGPILMLATAVPVHSTASATTTSLPPFPFGVRPDGRTVFSPARDGFAYSVSGGLVAYPRSCSPWDMRCWTDLTDNPTAGTADDMAGEAYPDVSPTGNKVAFARWVTLGYNEDELTGIRYPWGANILHILDLRTGLTQRLDIVHPNPESGLLSLSGLAWSPDEQKIALTSGPMLLVTEIGTEPGSRGATRRLAPPEDHACLDPESPRSGSYAWPRSPTWSPDGTKIAFAMNTGGEHECAGVWITGAGSLADARRLYVPYATAVDWSHDGSTIAASTFRDGTVLLDASSGGVRTQLADFHIIPRWAPSGDRLSLGGAPVSASGTPLTTFATCHGYDPSEYPDRTPYLCASASSGGNEFEVGDPQCSPGNCLSGIVLRARADSNFLGMINVTGGVTGLFSAADNDYLFARRAPGTYQITLSPEASYPVAVRCDDTDSTAAIDALAGVAHATVRVTDSEIVTCILDLRLANDRDNDGILDEIDICPDDPTNRCLDADLDGIPDGEDPCPLDASNSCVPEDDEEPVPTTCKAFSVDVTGNYIGSAVPVGVLSTDGTVCRTATGAELRNVRGTASDVTPPLLKALTSVFFTLEPSTFSDPHVEYLGPTTATVTGHWNMCVLPTPPGVGALLAKGLGKLLGFASRFGGDRLLGKIAAVWSDLWITALLKATDGVEGVGKIVAQRLRDTEARLEATMRSALDSAFGGAANVSGALNLPPLCFPLQAWVPSVTVVAQGAAVAFEVDQTGWLLQGTVTHVVNATEN